MLLLVTRRLHIWYVALSSDTGFDSIVLHYYWPRDLLYYFWAIPLKVGPHTQCNIKLWYQIDLDYEQWYLVDIKRVLNKTTVTTQKGVQQ